MKADPLTIVIVVALIGLIITGFMWAFAIGVTKMQVLIASMLFIGGSIAIILVKLFLDNPKQTYNKDLEYAEKIARDFWFRRHSEYLIGDKKGQGIVGWFGDGTRAEKFFGFSFTRKGSDQTGRPLIIVVGKNPWGVVRWETNPSYEEIRNPLNILGGMFTRSPTQFRSLDSEPLFKTLRRPPAGIEQHFHETEEKYKDFYEKKKK